ncbi:MAG: PLP-dependent transferase [Planctomycetales bacterium]|nr:PLP-dependent transferase [Planctomycetales bacterium]
MALDAGERPLAETISLTNVWQFDSPESASAALSGETSAHVYRRVTHPNERNLATKLAALHGAPRAVVTAQGMSATSALALAILRPQAEVWIGHELYGETSKLFQSNLAQWQITTRVFDPCRDDHLAELADSQSALTFIETLTNPRLRVPNIAAVAQATHQAGGRLAVDNTFATHLLCRPLQHGADFVVESLGKQVNGHSDAMLGLICGRDELAVASVADTVKTMGWASSPMDCYLTHRGLLSLAVRMERACSNAQALAQALADCAAVEGVDYPGLASHANHSTANEQLVGGYGWMLSFHVPPDRHGVAQLFAGLRPEISFAPSLGDASTTLSHPLSTSHRSLSADDLARLGIQHGTIRVSCGLEPTQWLVERFLSALR